MTELRRCPSIAHGLRCLRRVGHDGLHKHDNGRTTTTWPDTWGEPAQSSEGYGRLVMTDGNESHYVALRDADGNIIWRWGMDNQRLSTRPISLDVDGVVVWRSDQAKQESEG